MSYESPAQIRRRQQRAEDRACRPVRRAKRVAVQVLSPLERETVAERLALSVERAIAAGDPYSAGLAAKFAVQSARSHRASEIVRDCNRAWWKAMEMARVELYAKI